MRAQVQDVKAHPWTDAGHALGLALPFSKIPEAVEGIITAAKALKTAVDLHREVRAGNNP